MTTESRLTVLHLSDFHIRNTEEGKVDLGIVLDPLLARVKKDYDGGLRPELVFVTGDIAFQGIKAEYDLAFPFFHNLLEALHLDSTNLYIVPGNHDVYRKAYRPGDIPQYDTNRDINAELSNDDYRADLFKGMTAYFDFIRTHFPHMTSHTGDLVPFVDRFVSKSGMGVGLVGLNSAWMCRYRKNDRDDSGEIAIGEHQIKCAFQELDAKGDVDVTFALFHHPLGWLAPMDRRICMPKLNRTIALCGHLHEPAGGYVHQFSSEMVHIQAGGVYLGSDSNWPSRYHYLGVDTQAAGLTAYFRVFSESGHRWFVDTETGDDNGAAVIPANFVQNKQKGDPASPALEIPSFPEAYAAWIAANYEYLEAEKLGPKGKAPRLSLPEIFTPLCAADPVKKEPSDKEKIDEENVQDIRRERENPPEVESLVAKYNALLLEGQAGSGKSTVLKHLAFILSPSTKAQPSFEGLDEYLPVLIQLKELQVYCRSDLIKESRACPVGEEMLAWYVKNRLSGKLELDLLNRFIACGRVLLMIDGLDEIERPLRDHAVHALADVVLTHKKNKIVLAGRPHGLEGAPTNRFDNFRTTVEELSPKQIEYFVRQWFDYFRTGTGLKGKKGADEMLADMSEHPAIDQLTSNPLMLTAICLLYLDEKALPDQRAELFKKFIDNMLWRRFDNPEPVHDSLKQLAYDMHTDRVRLMDRSDAVRTMAKVGSPHPDETSKAFKKRMAEQFDLIEPQCGLLINKEGQYGFWHLAFQEFLTAQQLMDICDASYDAIKPYWDDDWFKEVVELYISYLSIDHKRTANTIVLRAVGLEDNAPYKRWRLAGRALKDFHQNRRTSEAATKVKERLLRILEKPGEPAVLFDAGETLGWLGDDRKLDAFVTISEDEYEREGIGEQSISEFEIGQFPVTNQWFSKFIDDGGYENENLWTLYGKLFLKRLSRKQPATWKDRRFRCLNQPVTGVSWYEAAAFCSWLTHNDDAHRYFLPSQEQWQAAAAGAGKRKYPWGADWNQGVCNTKESQIGRPSPVGIFTESRTPDTRIYDMAGNVWEWTVTNDKSNEPADDFLYDEDIEKQIYSGVPIIKGGSWADSAGVAACAYRGSYGYPTYWGLDVGFRCARTK